MSFPKARFRRITTFSMRNSTIFGESDAWRLLSFRHPNQGTLTCAVSLCVSGAVRRDFDVCDVAACVFVAQPLEICGHSVSLSVRRFRALVAVPFLSFESCTCAVHVVCMFAVQSGESCVLCFLRAVD